MNTNKRLCAYIDLDAVEHNFDCMKAALHEGTLMTAVIKADGYGHGAVPIGKMLETREDIWGYAVATAEEGAALRHAGLKKPILLLGYVFPENHDILIQHDLRACLFTYEDARVLSENAAAAGKTVTVHIAVDTGMSRIGFPVTEAAAETVQAIAALKNLVIEGVFTHFARADETDPAPARAQLDAFLTFVGYLKARGLDVPLIHAGNSASIMTLPEANLSMVRTGITLYGLSPSEAVPRTCLGLEPVMSLVSHISYVKDLPAGQAVSYGGTFVADRPLRLATIPAGYADGYPRMLSNKADVLIRGQRAPVVGRICMDQFMVDVTGIPEAEAGDEVVLLGRQGEAVITAEELGELSGRFNYELTCDINKRVPRIYRRHGKSTEQVDYFL